MVVWVWGKSLCSLPHPIMCNGSSPSSSINFFAFCKFFSKYLLLLAEHTNCKDSRVLLLLYKVFQYSPQPSLHSFCSAYSFSLLLSSFVSSTFTLQTTNHDMKFSLLNFMLSCQYHLIILLRLLTCSLTLCTTLMCYWWCNSQL